MIKNAIFVIKFYLKYHIQTEVTIEDDGLSLNELRQSIQSAIDDDEYYVVHDLLSGQWTVIRADSIQAFTITTITEVAEYMQPEGFDFK